MAMILKGSVELVSAMVPMRIQDRKYKTWCLVTAFGIGRLCA